MKRIGSRLLAALLVSSVLVGCGSAGSSPSGKGGDAGPDVRLLSAGSGGLRTIRLVVDEGASQRGTMTMTMGAEMTVDGQKIPAGTVPPMEMDFDFDVTKVRPDGVIESTFRYGDTRVDGDGPGIEDLVDQLATIEGTKGSFTTTDRGAVLDATVDVPKGMNATMRQTMESMQSQMQNLSVPFPVEAVGVGASWTYPTEAEINGIRMKALYTYTLKSRTDDRVVLTYSAQQEAPEQDPKIPGMPDGVSVHLDQMKMRSTGTVVVALGSAMPVTLRSSGSGSSTMTMKAEGRSQEMRQDITVAVKFDPR